MNSEKINEEVMNETSDEIISQESLSILRVGTILMGVSPKKSEQNSNEKYYIATSSSLKNFQYHWYLKRFVLDPIEYAVGDSVTASIDSRFKKVGFVMLDESKLKEWTDSNKPNKIKNISYVFSLIQATLRKKFGC